MIRPLTCRFKFTFLLLIFTCLSLNNKLLKLIKEACVLTIPEGGITLVPFLKMWLIIPFSILLIALFRALNKRYTLYSVFQIILGSFLGIYLLFLMLLPERNNMPILFGDGILPDPLVLMLHNWPSALFYVVGDMWSTLLISILFWNLAALNFKLDEAKNFYPLFSLDISGILAGIVGLTFAHSLETLLMAVITVNLIIMVLLYKFHKTQPIVQTDPLKKEEMQKPISRNTVAFFLGIIIFSYEFSDSFLDLMWKWKVSEIYPHAEKYSFFMSQIALIMGILGTLICLFIARPLAKKVKWQTLALITPGLVLICAGLFFTSIYLDLPTESVLTFGLIMSISLQIGKYTFFDNSKELALVVQSENDRTLAKEFADGLMTRVGKSSASFLQQAMFIFLLNVEALFPFYAAVFVFFALVLWIYATLSLNPHIEEKYA